MGKISLDDESGSPRNMGQDQLPQGFIEGKDFEMLNDDQIKALDKIGLSAKDVAEIEQQTHWRFGQHTNGTDARFHVRWVKGRFSLIVWLKNHVSVGIWIDSQKSGAQELFKKKLGTWAPNGMRSSSYDDPGGNPDRGHVGDWVADTITKEQFRDNVESVRGMVDEILKKLEDEGVWKELSQGKPFEQLDPLLGTKVYGQDSMGKNQEPEKVMANKQCRNRLVFGAPGTGKSYLLEKERAQFPEANYERVTFYATYSYAQFVGTYKPVMKGEGENEKIAYQFVPGPFLRMLVKALNKPNENFLLIIEEINRANAAAVFGDVFQLLDRGDDGVSEYAVAASEDVKKYLAQALTDTGKQALVALSGSVDMLKIPANMYLWATMNSADQGVFPLDTAFKRRWSFEYIGIDDGEPQAPDLKIQIKNQTYDWKPLRKFLNRLLVLNGVNEDKLMGPFFLKNASEFNSKVLMYLWEDAARMCRRAVFGEIKTYSDLCDEWEEKGIKIFDVAKFDDAKLNGCREALQPGDNPPTKDDAATAQEANND